MKSDLEKVLNRCHHDPFCYLGAHFSSPDNSHFILRTFQPHALTVSVVIDSRIIQMEQTHPEGLFELTCHTAQVSEPLPSPFSYQYDITFTNGSKWLTNDPYRFAVSLGDEDIYLFNGGKNYKIYEHLGAHQADIESVKGTIFRVWAPNADAISVVGNFNSWDARPHQMRCLGESGLWELFIPHLNNNEVYKFSILSKNGQVLEKSDPFQFYGEIRPKSASVVQSLDVFTWTDENWQKEKREKPLYDKPLAIYEVHPGSWQRDPSEPDRFLTYRELANSLIPYVKKLGFSHVELLPVMEHPLDESWGYQVTAPYSISSRYGTVNDFMFFVNACHEAEIGVILDWVPAHFPMDQHSLGQFDGTALYEHEDYRKGYHPEWGTFIYNYGRQEVSNYLIANAMFWLDKYHIDGLRVDAVASMLYLDYSRDEGEWIPNKEGGRENLEAIEFIRHLNSKVYEAFPHTLLIAEESTSFYGVSHPTDQGGLGFGFKWNMGWMNDILNYFSKDPLYRQYHHNNLTFSIMYAFSENFILPLSHDEVVHGKKSLLEKMPGDTWQKFANLRLLLLTMWMHPGKKLLFMGSEFGQSREWNCKSSLDWHLLEQAEHQQLSLFVEQLNEVYHANKSLYQLDFSPEGFAWLDLEDSSNSVISFVRYAEDKNDHLVCIFNYTPQIINDYKVGLPTERNYKELFCSNSREFGGAEANQQQLYIPVNEPYAQADFHTTLTLPPLAGLVLKPV